jgi:hypothetical protein
MGARESMIKTSAGRTSRPAKDREDKAMTTTENITTDTDIAYAVGTAANAWDDTDYWVDETGETIGLKRSISDGGQTLGLHVCDDVVSWGLWQYDADGFTIVHEGLSALTDETIAYLANWWLEH